VLEKAGLITQNLNNFYETVRVEADNANRRLDMAVERVNQISTEIRDIHRAMMRTPAPHNDLMDQHERLVKELSTYTKVTVTPKANNEGYNVHIGNGHTIVSGTESSKLAMLNGEPDPHQRRLAIVEGKIVKPIQQLDIDGELGALFDMRDKNIPYVYDELGRVAASLAFEVNKLQHQGLDIRGQIGAQMFNDVNSERAAQDRVIKGNESKAEMAVYLEDLSQLKGGEYSLKYDGKRYAITNGRGEVTRLEPASDGALHFEGVRIEISKKPQVNEKILIRPTRMAAGELTLMMNDPAKIAAQSYESSTTFAQGTAKFDILSVGDLKEFEVIISPQGDQFAVLDTKGNVLQSPQPYPTDDAITVMGTQFTLTAGALPNDKFGANLVGSEGDNGNLRKLQDIQTSKIFNDGNSTLLQLYHNLNTDVGLKYSTASRVANVAKLEHQAAQERVASISGVNLDEEAANMMKFQNAYMASSRIMQTANDTFNTILQLR
jgi:flagellar hook-associated protein 1 FlgK